MTETNKKVSTFQERFAELLDERPESDTELAKKLMVSKQTVSAWRTGVRSPKINTAASIARAFGVNVDWLFGYDVKKEASEYRLPDGLTPVASMPMYRTPLIGSTAAGAPINDPESWEEYIDSPVKADYALRVKGDSMEPLYLDGDIVYIRETPEVYDGKVAVVLVDDSVTLKYVYHIQDGLQLVSQNRAYQPMNVTWPEYDTIRVLGVPVGYTRMYK